MDKKGQAKSASGSLAERINVSETDNTSQISGPSSPPPLPPTSEQSPQGRPHQRSPKNLLDTAGRTQPPPVPQPPPQPKPAPMRRSPQTPPRTQTQSDSNRQPAASQKTEFDKLPPYNVGEPPQVPAGIRPTLRQEQSKPAANPNIEEPQRRTAQRRPAGPPRERIAANDDAPSIGGLIYALNQRPSKKPFIYAAIASGIWAVTAIAFSWAFMSSGIDLSQGVSGIVTHPNFLTAVATILGPIILFWFLAFLMWRTEELHLRSSAMTEVAVRLAEPDRMAEHSVASLGQAVRRQVSFMNDAVTRALGRAGELEALVHNEVSALEQSYEENERKIRGLIKELSGERHALKNTGEGFHDTLLQLGAEVPQIIESLSRQQLKLTQIIEHAGTNLTQLETAIGGQTEKLETSLGDNTDKLQTVLEDYTSALATALSSRTQQMQNLLENNQEVIDGSMKQMDQRLTHSVQSIGSQLDKSVGQIEQRVGKAVQNVDSTLNSTLHNIDDSLTNRTEIMQSVLEEYARALDMTLANRTNIFDTQLVERTKALDEAFTERLRLFDEAIMRSTLTIDQTVSENTRIISSNLQQHVGAINETMVEQGEHLDNTLVRGIESVRATSENISRQSIRAIEGLANQSDLLREVSENVLGQITGVSDKFENVSNKFENQSNTIMLSATALEAANNRIDKILSERSAEINTTLDRVSERADEIGSAFSSYSRSLEGSMSQAHERAKALTQDLKREAEEQAQATYSNMKRLKEEASREADRALNDLQNEFSSVSREVTNRLGDLSNQFSDATGEVRKRAALAAKQLEDEQGRLKQQIDHLPQATEESSTAMRKALRDQLKALDQLSELANRTGMSHGASPPLRSEAAQQIQEDTSQRPQRFTNEPSRPLKTLSSTLAREMNERMQARSHAPEQESSANTQNQEDTRSSVDTTQPGEPDYTGLSPQQSYSKLTQTNTDNINPTQNTESPTNSGQWSFGELLSRMPEDEQDQSNNVMQESVVTPESAPDEHRDQKEIDAPLDIATISQALDPTAAAAIWSRFRSGQRGFMVRSIYSPEYRQLFDDIVYRYKNQATFRGNVDLFVHEFEQTLRDSDQRDPTGQLTQSHIIADAGRVYLLLAHASQRLA